jgi:peptidoglycan/LPS O-acetylase OafA/YrhL
MTFGGIARRPRLDSLTSLRFFAALLVVLHHTVRDAGTIPGVTNILSMGTAGVGFFFALSGFVLTWSARDDDTKRAFYRRRFARVYPLHFATFLLAIPVLVLAGREIGLWEWATNLVLVQGWIPDADIYFGMNSPSWSLSGELLFYLLFPFAIPILRRLNGGQAWVVLIGLLALILIIALVVTWTAGSTDSTRFWLYIFPPYRFLGFLSGCLAARLIILGFRLNHPVSAAALYALLAYGAVFLVQSKVVKLGHGLEDALLLPFILFLILAAASADLRGRPRMLSNIWLIRLGEWSFALYLTHWLLLQVLAALWTSLPEQSLPIRVAVDAAFIVLAVAVSAASYYGIERPLEKRLRKAPVRAEEAVAATD